MNKHYKIKKGTIATMVHIPDGETRKVELDDSSPMQILIGTKNNEMTLMDNIYGTLTWTVPKDSVTEVEADLTTGSVTDENGKDLSYLLEGLEADTSAYMSVVEKERA